MSKKIKKQINLTITAGKANPAPPVGPALGQAGVKIPEFCREFNDRTKDMGEGTPVPVVITVYEDRSFSFVTKQPPASHFIKKYAKIDKGSSETQKIGPVGEITKEDLEKIAKLKMPDLNTKNLESAMKIIEGSAYSMGILVKEK
jgi:large subunit ribosomal protein L11